MANTKHILAPERLAQLKALSAKIGYEFADYSHLDKALTHSSYRNHANSVQPYSEINECLEFLGDSVLDFIISEYLYQHYSSWNEGKLSKFRAKIVCEQSLVLVANRLNLWDSILVGNGENVGPRMNPSIMADAVEAMIAAAYLDGGMEPVKKLVMGLLSQNIQDIQDKKILRDCKTDLQEMLQHHHDCPVVYQVINKEGPQHDSIFTVEARLQGRVIGTGQGRNKKEAEQAAALQGIELLEKEGYNKCN